MSGVSGRVIDVHRRYMDHYGLSFAGLVRDLAARYPDDPSFRSRHFSDPRERIPWTTFAHFSREFGALARSLHGDRWQEHFSDFLFASGGMVIPLTKTAAFLAWNAKFAYRINNLLMGPSAFGNTVIPSLESMPGGRLKIVLKLQEGAVDCPEFFQISSYGMRKFPKIVGLNESLVDADIRPGIGTYLVTPPPAASVWTRFWRLIRIPFASSTIITELGQQESMMRDHYERLVKSEADLMETRRELERRVAERTRELETANSALKARIDEILARREENRELNERIHQLQKIEAVGTLVGGISHEINNVLHGTFLSIDLAERSLAPDHPARERVLMAKRFTQRGQSLMKQILTFSRKSRLEFKAIPVKAALEDVIQLMRSTFPKSVAIAFEAEGVDDSTAVLSDATQLQQVLINLGSNAAYAMKKDGGTLRIRLTEDANEVTLKISDTGEGIPEGTRDRIFEPFFTTKPQGEGTGVGLSVVHGIVTAHGGRISVESHLGLGTEFTIVLPTVPLDLPEEQLSDLHNLGGSERIVVVDDDPELLDVLGDTLGAFGYRIDKASTASEALLSLEREEADLVLTDYSMPGMNGIELARLVRRDHPTTKIILCTGFRDLFGSEAAELDLVDARVSKPLDAFALNREIRACLGQPEVPTISL